MKRFLITTAMTLMLSCSALAGEIPCGAPSPPPAGTTQTADATSPGDIPCDLAGQVSDATLSGLLAVLGALVV